MSFLLNLEKSLFLTLLEILGDEDKLVLLLKDLKMLCEEKGVKITSDIKGIFSANNAFGEYLCVNLNLLDFTPSRLELAFYLSSGDVSVEQIATDLSEFTNGADIGSFLLFNIMEKDLELRRQCALSFDDFAQKDRLEILASTPDELLDMLNSTFSYSHITFDEATGNYLSLYDCLSTADLPSKQSIAVMLCEVASRCGVNLLDAVRQYRTKMLSNVEHISTRALANVIGNMYKYNSLMYYILEHDIIVMFFNRQLDRIELYNLSNSHSSEAVDILEHRLSDVFKLLNLKLHVLKKTIMHPIADKNFFAKMIYLADISCSHYINLIVLKKASDMNEILLNHIEYSEEYLLHIVQQHANKLRKMGCKTQEPIIKRQRRNKDIADVLSLISDYSPKTLDVLGYDITGNRKELIETVLAGCKKDKYIRHDYICELSNVESLLKSSDAYALEENFGLLISKFKHAGIIKSDLKCHSIIEKIIRNSEQGNKEELLNDGDVATKELQNFLSYYLYDGMYILIVKAKINKEDLSKLLKDWIVYSTAFKDKLHRDLECKAMENYIDSTLSEIKRKLETFCSVSDISSLYPENLDECVIENVKIENSGQFIHEILINTAKYSSYCTSTSTKYSYHKLLSDIPELFTNPYKGYIQQMSAKINKKRENWRKVHARLYSRIWNLNQKDSKKKGEQTLAKTLISKLSFKDLSTNHGDTRKR